MSFLASNLLGQHNTTSAGGSEIVTNSYHHSFTLGEVLNVHSVTTEKSNKSGILQPITLISTNVEELTDPIVTIYPNPTTDYLHIAIENQNEMFYKILNIHGEVIKSGKLDSYYTIDVRNLVDGTYFLSLPYNGRRIFKKFIKINTL